MLTYEMILIDSKLCFVRKSNVVTLIKKIRISVFPKMEFFLSVFIRLLISERESVESKMKRLEAQYASFQIVSIVGRYGDDRVSKNR